MRHRIGNYLLFFPSYDYLAMVQEQFSRDNGNVEILLQTSDMDERQREAFLARFQESLERSLVGFAVMGGIFGEGIDLKGDRLTAAAVVGVGLPGICLQRDLIREYYDQNGGRGFAFAYKYPGINRVLQAAGRVIRSEKDRGVVLLIDRRYGQSSYHELLPAHWRTNRIADGIALQKALAGFWRTSTASDT
ncbi:MAG: helicase C-terminal domain-containing protein [Desulfosarcinaceae bacterium]